MARAGPRQPYLTTGCDRKTTVDHGKRGAVENGTTGTGSAPTVSGPSSGPQPRLHDPGGTGSGQATGDPVAAISGSCHCPPRSLRANRAAISGRRRVLRTRATVSIA